jgi:hypothetical protein
MEEREKFGSLMQPSVPGPRTFFISSRVHFGYMMADRKAFASQ